MQLLVDIQNESMADKIVQMLSIFKHDGVEVKRNIFENSQHKYSEDEKEFSDKYIEENWQDVVSRALYDYNDDYARSFQYKMDRADFDEMKEGI
jgi:hypothetical protein